MVADCAPGPAPVRPVLHWTKCGANVCLPPEEALQLWAHERAVDRWHDRVQVCNDNRTATPSGDAP